MTFPILKISVPFFSCWFSWRLKKGAFFPPRYFPSPLHFTDIFVNPLISLRIDSNIIHFALRLFPESSKKVKENQ